MRVAGSVALACALSACFLDPPPAPPPPSAVGPAPLRRLTNEEYLNALHDLFPGQAPTLPPLPADGVIGGFDNAIVAQQPSDVAVARYEAIANIYAAGATADDVAVRALVGCDWTTPSMAASCATQFITQTGRRVFRRPLTTDEITRFQVKLTGWQSAVDFQAAVRLTLSAMLQSPELIYRPEPPSLDVDAGSSGVAPLDPYALATRLSFLLWASTPDDSLLDAAGSGALATEEGVRAQAQRMLGGDRARRTLWSFHRQWLGLDLVLTADQTYRTPTIDPLWTPATPVSAERETELFIENTLMSGGTLRDVLLSPHAWIDAEMARIYGVPFLGEVDLPEAERAGVLTRVAFLAGTSHAGGTSPPIRGNAVELRWLCALPVSPPPGADLSMPTTQPNQGPATTRMLFEARTAPPVCQGCHASLNGIGFGFEHYNAAGAYRATEVGLPIDSRGVLMGTDVDGAFDGAIALSAALDRSGTMHRCATMQWLRYALGRAPTDAELPLQSRLTTSFVASGGDVRALLLDIVTSPTFRFQKVGN
jgi:hypothetical protein